MGGLLKNYKLLAGTFERFILAETQTEILPLFMKSSWDGTSGNIPC
jgi:hypothetical protein